MELDFVGSGNTLGLTSSLLRFMLIFILGFVQIIQCFCSE